MKVNLLSLFACILLLTNCKKDKPDESDAPKTGTVTIEQKTYSTVIIDNLEWTTQNYNGSVGEYYQQLNNETYGKLLSLKQTKQIVLPDGWRIPTVEDYVKLINKNGGFVSYNSSGAIDKQIIDKDIKADAVKSLLSTNLWSIAGTNASGFNAVPGGIVNSSSQYEDKGVFCALWTSTIYQEGSIYQPMLLGLFTDGGSHEGYFAEFAQPITSLTLDTKGKASLRFVRNR